VTSVGGDLLPTEAVVVPGKGKLVITGLLEKGMEESAQAAMSYVRSRSSDFGLDSDFYVRSSTCTCTSPTSCPRTGRARASRWSRPSLSALSRSPVRRDVAMTGEITLRGRVLPIGG
jgi:ATP-dependent Lon protease